ncbi:hypothetical protein [uncultured Clostridium sp.]|uniref:hypothetical protein n=1 Tax=uncultured Clostridium sp. TaxID=59620 RepID=UPI0025FB06D0|nr:hypothetical protein [uncultured Clostridium sp.]
MVNKIVVESVEANKNKVEVKFNVQGSISSFFKQNLMYIEYEESMENVPKGILVIPFISNVVQIAWFFNSEILVPELDRNFYESLNEIKNSFSNMFTKAKLGGNIIADKINDYEYIPQNKSATFFSGGVDSLATLITKIDEKPDLVTLWGSDIKLSDNKGWNKVKTEVSNFAKSKALKNIFIKSNFREFIIEQNLDEEFNKVTETQDGWWFGVQHGIGLLGHIAPYAYKYKLRTTYIPASLNIKSENYRIASHPSIDNKFKVSAMNVIHDGFENTRQDKIKIICDYIKRTKEDIKIRVCWQSEGGDNCSVCEKCSRTIMGIIAEKVDPNQLGFNINKDTIMNIKRNWKYKWNVHGPNIMHWNDVKERFMESEELWKGTELEWILKIDFFKEGNFKRTLGGKIRNKLYKMIIL